MKFKTLVTQHAHMHIQAGTHAHSIIRTVNKYLFLKCKKGFYKEKSNITTIYNDAFNLQGLKFQRWLLQDLHKKYINYTIYINALLPTINVKETFLSSYIRLFFFNVQTITKISPTMIGNTL